MCAQVRLAVPEGDNFERCAIEIWVKFRDEEDLQRLSSHRQSGGERSVSTILYLIAIQARPTSTFSVFRFRVRFLCLLQSKAHLQGLGSDQQSGDGRSASASPHTTATRRARDTGMMQLSPRILLWM